MYRFAVPLAALCLLSSSAVAQVASGSARYAVTQGDKNVGEAQYTSRPIPGGATLESSGKLATGKFSYDFTANETVDAQGNLVRDVVTGNVHGQKASGNNIRFEASSDSSGRAIDIRIEADGKQTTNTVDRHRNLVLMPDLDPGAYALMAHLALSQPRTAWILIPKENGILVPAEYEALADLRGTFNGQNITVKHSAVAISMENSLVVELFYTATGDLLEADLNAQGLRVEQDGFKLLNRPKPVAPPANQPPAQNGTQSGQPQQPPYGQPQ